MTQVQVEVQTTDLLTETAKELKNSDSSKSLVLSSSSSSSSSTKALHLHEMFVKGSATMSRHSDQLEKGFLQILYGILIIDYQSNYPVPEPYQKQWGIFSKKTDTEFAQEQSSLHQKWKTKAEAHLRPICKEIKSALRDIESSYSSFTNFDDEPQRLLRSAQYYTCIDKQNNNQRMMVINDDAKPLRVLQTEMEKLIEDFAKDKESADSKLNSTNAVAVTPLFLYQFIEYLQNQPSSAAADMLLYITEKMRKIPPTPQHVQQLIKKSISPESGEVDLKSFLSKLLLDPHWNYYLKVKLTAPTLVHCLHTPLAISLPLIANPVNEEYSNLRSGLSQFVKSDLRKMLAYVGPDEEIPEEVIDEGIKSCSEAVGDRDIKQKLHAVADAYQTIFEKALEIAKGLDLKVGISFNPLRIMKELTILATMLSNTNVTLEEIDQRLGEVGGAEGVGADGAEVEVKPSKYFKFSSEKKKKYQEFSRQMQDMLKQQGYKLENYEEICKVLLRPEIVPIALFLLPFLDSLSPVIQELVDYFLQADQPTPEDVIPRLLQLIYELALSWLADANEKDPPPFLSELPETKKFSLRLKSYKTSLIVKTMRKTRFIMREVVYRLLKKCLQELTVVMPWEEENAKKLKSGLLVLITHLAPAMIDLFYGVFMGVNTYQQQQVSELMRSMKNYVEGDGDEGKEGGEREVGDKNEEGLRKAIGFLDQLYKNVNSNGMDLESAGGEEEDEEGEKKEGGEEKDEDVEEEGEDKKKEKKKGKKKMSRKERFMKIRHEHRKTF